MEVDQRLTIAPLAPPGGRYLGAVSAALADQRARLDRALDRFDACTPALAAVAEAVVETLRAGGKALVAGNGGSAAEAQHFAAELVGRFKRDRDAYAALALTADTATLTAVANDYGYDQVFARQVAAVGRPGDLLVLFSTSGESESVVQAARVARERGLKVAALTADRASRLERLADVAVRVPAADTATAQELHMMATHIVCGIVESALSAWDGAVD